MYKDSWLLNELKQATPAPRGVGLCPGLADILTRALKNYPQCTATGDENEIEYGQ